MSIAEKTTRLSIIRLSIYQSASSGLFDDVTSSNKLHHQVIRVELTNCKHVEMRKLLLMLDFVSYP